MWWLGIRAAEAWLVARLLASPSFHRLVCRMHGRVTGTPQHRDDDFAHLGGTRLEGHENPVKRFLRLYYEEFRNEFRRK